MKSPARHRTAAFFDLDKTIIAKSSTLAFGRTFYRGGLISRRALLKSSYAQFGYLIGGADATQMDAMRDYLAQLCRGWDAEQVRDIVEETLHELIDPLIFDEAAALIEEHRTAGRDVVIVSSSGEEIVAPIGAMLGADQVIATQMVIEHGRYSGEVAFYASGENKATAMLALAVAEGYDLAESYAYSDSATDLPMLLAVGHPCAVNPDRALRREAAARGWPILEFRRAVALRDRLPSFARPPRPVVAGAAVTVAAVGVGFGWLVVRRRTRYRPGLPRTRQSA